MAVAPPTAEASVPTRVMTIWMVARNVSGSRFSESAVAAPRTDWSRRRVSRA